MGRTGLPTNALGVCVDIYQASAGIVQNNKINRAAMVLLLNMRNDITSLDNFTGSLQVFKGSFN